MPAAGIASKAPFRPDGAKPPLSPKWMVKFSGWKAVIMKAAITRMIMPSFHQTMMLLMRENQRTPK